MGNKSIDCERQGGEVSMAAMPEWWIRTLCPLRLFFFLPLGIRSELQLWLCSKARCSSPLGQAGDWTCVLALQRFCLPCCTTAGTPLLEFLIDTWQRGITEQNTNMITNDIRTSSSWTCVQRPEIHEKNKLSLHFEIFPSITSSPFEIDTENYLDWS